MKSPDTYIDEVYEKYNETKKNKQKYKSVKMRPKISIVPISSLAVCLVLALYVTVGNNKCVPGTNEFVYTDYQIRNKTIYIDTLFADSPKTDNYIKKMIDNAEYIAIISKIDYTSTGYENVNGRIILKTKSTLRVNEALKGNIENMQSINCYEYGGEIAFKELVDDENIDWNKWIVEYKLYENSIENGIFKQVVNDAIQLEEGKQYLVFMNYNEKKSAYEIFDMKYGIMELDVNTNKVKMTETGEFEDFDWDLIENS